MIKHLILVFLVSFAFATNALELPNNITELRIELDRINFVLKEKEPKLERLEELISHIETLSEANPKDPAYLLMAGLYNLQYASYDGGIGALKYAKAARNYLDQSIAIDPTLYGASAHAVLGRMYTVVPGWPIGFGNEKKGVKNMKKALELSPDTVDSNFTYASYLYEQKKYAESKVHLKKAKAAPARKNREIADKELHKAIDKALIDIEQKLS